MPYITAVVSKELLILEALIKQAHKLSILVLQTDLYIQSPDVKQCVDDVLFLSDRAAGRNI